jgi:UDP-N-acetylmuramyl pentapeptide phosphotransferase/UDP-N-acetylglucosamine-1-phosphate transferase
MMEQMSYPFIITLLFSLVGTKAMTILTILDNPIDNRSSHNMPTPTSGGVAVITSFLLFLFLSKVPLTMTVGAIIGGATLIAAIGFIDEFHEITFKVRLILQLFIGGILLIIVLRPDLTFSSILYVIALWILLGGFTNAFNFIDGLNGMCGGGAMVAAIFAGLYFPEQSLYYFALVPALLGFLVFNVRGKIFLGDVGSLFLGFIFPALLLLSPTQLKSSILILGHLFFPYLSDISVTIFRRLLAGQTVVYPHRDFFFLRLHRAGLNHLQVAVIFAGFTLFQGLTLFIFPLKTGIEFLYLYVFDSIIYGFVLYMMNAYFHQKVTV